MTIALLDSWRPFSRGAEEGSRRRDAFSSAVEVNNREYETLWPAVAPLVAWPRRYRACLTSWVLRFNSRELGAVDADVQATIGHRDSTHRNGMYVSRHRQLYH